MYTNVSYSQNIPEYQQVAQLWQRNRATHAPLKFQTEGGVAHQSLLVSENWSDCPFAWYQNIRSALFGLSQSTRVTDRQTDRITTPKTALLHTG